MFAATSLLSGSHGRGGFAAARLKGWLAAAGALALPLLAHPARGQSFPGCVAGGRAIPTFATTQIPDGAMAGFTPEGVPVIFINPAAAVTQTALFQKWVYLHECGHHVLGHTTAGLFGFRRPYVDEQEADCWAIRRLRDDGLSPQALFALQSEASVLLNRTGDTSHLPAIARALNLNRCLQINGDDTPAATCRTITTLRTETRMRLVPRQQLIPCQHPICNPYGCFRAHPMGDAVIVNVPEPYSVTAPVTTQVCDGGARLRASAGGRPDSGGDDAGAPPLPSSGRYRYRYQRITSDIWLPSISYATEAACRRAQQRKDESPDYLTRECEEITE